MKFHKIFSPILNEFNGSIQIRQKTGMPVPEPTICHAHQDLFRCKKSQGSHEETLYNIMKTRTIEKNFDKFDRNTVSAHWIGLHLSDCEDGLNAFAEKVTQHLEKIKLFAAEHNVDITENLNNMIDILEEYSKDKKIEEMLELLKKKKDVIKNWDLAIKSCVLEMKKEAKLEDPNLKNFDSIKYDNNIDTNINLSKMKTFIDDESIIFENSRTNKEPYSFNYRIIESYINRLDEENIAAFLKLRDAGIHLMLADKFMTDNKNASISKDVVGFLQHKITTKTNQELGIKSILEFNNSRIKEIIVFNDNSVLAKKSDGSYFDVFTIKHLKKIKDTLVEEHIRNIFKKNPTVAKNFIEIFKKDTSIITLEKLLVAINTYDTNIDFFNKKPFDIKNEYKEAKELSKNNNQFEHKVLEDLDDRMNKKIKDHKVEQLAHSIASNKYMNLYNDESYKIIESIFDLKLKTDVFQNYIGKKIAAYKTPEQFNEGLSNFLKSFNGFDMDSMVLKAENTGAKIISQSDDILIVEIENYEQSKILGSSSWCIVRDQSYFNSYTEDGNKQYFLYDFSLESSDNASMIGFTIDCDGDHYAAHYKDDEEINQDEQTLSYAHDMVNEFNYKETVNRTARMTYS